MCEPKYESYEINEYIWKVISVKLVRLKTWDKIETWTMYGWSKIDLNGWNWQDWSVV